MSENLYTLFWENYDVTFPYSDIVITSDQFWWLVGIKLGTVVLFSYLYMQATEMKKQLFWFLVFAIARLIDFRLTYNGDWFFIGRVPVCLDLIGFIGLGVMILLTIIYGNNSSSTN